MSNERPFASIILRRREGLAHSQEDIERIVRGATAQEGEPGHVPDYQLSAWLMACYFRPLSAQETAWLTQAMANSGERLDLTSLPRPWIDKHSTGGVGDKTTLVLMPLLAALGPTVVKMSGPGLGITGGTVDKLSSVPGFRMALDPEDMVRQAQAIGIAVTGQGPRLAPADGRLYSLRDTSASVESVPLIASSILSKKIAGGADTVVFDVKTGSGSFMPTLPQARELAEWLVRIGRECGLKVGATITDMSVPLGCTVGNALEVREAIQVLRQGPEGRFGDLCLHLGALALFHAGLARDLEDGVRYVRQSFSSGRALAKAREWFAAQGADPGLFDDDAALPRAPVIRTVTHDQPRAYVSGIHAGTVGMSVLDLGGGRRAKGDPIDPAVGFEFHVEVGDAVRRGEPLFTVHAASEGDAEEASHRIMADAFRWSDSPVPRLPVILDSDVQVD